MKKNFTINVPDELWVDSWKNNNTMSYDYDGPEKLYVKVKHDGDIADWSTNLFEDLSSGEKSVEVDASTSTDIAYFLVSGKDSIDYEYEDVKNPDGTIYKQIVNPRIQDIFYLDFNNDKLSLTAIYKKTDFEGTIDARKKLAYVKKYDDLYDFDTETQTVIDKFLSDTENYLKEMSTVYPWKYVTIPNNSPRIPALLVEKFKTLPTDLGGNI